MKAARLLLILAIPILGCTEANPEFSDFNSEFSNHKPSISADCPSSLNQDDLYVCTLDPKVSDVDEDESHTWSLGPSNTCSWASVDSEAGTVSGTPNDDDVGNCILSVKVNDGELDSDEFSQFVTVNNINPNLAISAPGAMTEDDEDTLLRADADVYADEEGFGIYSFDLPSGDNCGDHAINFAIDGNTGAINYQPAADYNGTCNIKVKFDDGNAGYVWEQITVFVAAVNDAPVISATCPANIMEDSAYSCSTAPSAIDVDGDPQTWVKTAADDCTWLSVHGTTGAVSGMPNDGDVGTCTLSFISNDGSLNSNIISQSIIVSNLAPTLSIADPDPINEDDALAPIRTALDVDASDEGFGTYSFDHANASNPSCSLHAATPGGLVLNPTDGAISFQPEADYNGFCYLNVLFDDGNGGVVSDQFMITVNPVNDAPIISASCNNNLNQDIPYSCAPSVMDVDTGDSHTWNTAAGHSCTWMTIDGPTGAVSGTPNDDDVGPCTLALKVNDGTVDSNIYSESVTVNNVTPMLSINDASNILENSGSSVIRLGGDVQADEEDFGIYSFDHFTTTSDKCDNNKTTLSIDDSTGAVTFQPANGYFGTCNIKVVFDDEEGATASSEFAITVEPLCPAVVSFQAGGSQRLESVLTAEIMVQLSQTCSTPISMDLNTSGGNATPGSDYTAISGSGNFVIPPGQLSANVTVDLIDDGIVDGLKAFNLVISNPSHGVGIGTNSSHNYEILDDEAAAGCSPGTTVKFSNSISFKSETIVAPNFSVEVSPVCPVQIVLDLETLQDSATADVDFQYLNRQITIAAAATNEAFAIAINDDADAEDSESFRLRIKNPSDKNVSIQLDTHNYIIQDNDAGSAPCPGIVEFEYANSSAAEQIGTVVLNVKLMPPCPGNTVQVDYATSDNSATEGATNDYNASSGTLFFGPGQSFKTISFIVNDDAVASEVPESLFVKLSNPNLPEVRIGKAVHTFTIFDNDNGQTFYYVNPTGGSDVNSGLFPGDAWQTLNKAASDSSIAPGDSIFIGPGIYVEQFMPQKNGNSTNRIHYIADRTGINTNLASGDVIIKNPGYDIMYLGIGGREFLTFDGFRLEDGDKGIAVSGSFKSLVFKNMTIQNVFGAGISTGSGTGLNAFRLENSVINNVASHAIQIGPSTNGIFLFNNLIFNNTGSGISVGSSSTNINFQNNTFYANGAAQIRFYSSVTGLVKNNIVSFGAGVSEGIRCSGGPPVINYNNFFGNTTNYSGCGFGSNDISVNPQFMSISPGTENFRVHDNNDTIDSGSSFASSLIFTDGTSLADKCTRGDFTLDGDTKYGDQSKVNMGYHY